jgi:hypothetical protein
VTSERAGIVALNTNSSSDTIGYSTSGIGGTSGTVTPWLTNGSSTVAAQPAISLSGGAFSATIPARSLVTYVIKPGTTGNTIIITNPGTQNGTVGVPITPVHITVTDSDPTATPIISSVLGVPPGLTFNAGTSTFSGTPTSAGAVSTTMTATDGTGAASAPVTFAWSISPAGNPITIKNPGPQTGTVGVPITPLPISITDSNSGATLTVSVTSLPGGLVFNAGSDTFTGTPTTAGTFSVTISASDGTATGSASFTWTIKPAGGGSCHVAYTTNSQWPGGFTAQVVIGNTSTTAITSWTLSFTFPGDQKISSNFNGGFTQAGENATLTNASYNGSIAAGGSVTVGFQGSWTSSDAVPTSFALNGAACS